MLKIAVITYHAPEANHGESVVDEDRLVESVLRELGVDFSFEVWSDQNVDWSQYSHLLMKSPWDYFDRYQEFLSWCKRIQSLRIPVLNDIETVIWNSDKRYLVDVEAEGFPIVPTHFLPKGEEVDLEPLFDRFQTDILVLKPTVSGGAKNTLKLDRETWRQKFANIKQLVGEEAMMLQPFVPQITEVGEYSYIFFNGRFSHSVLKSPKKGEFRVQHFFGGEIHPTVPADSELSYIQKIAGEFVADKLYARIDGAWVGDTFWIMELELIEPYLFLFTNPNALGNYKNAIAKKLKIGS